MTGGAEGAQRQDGFTKAGSPREPQQQFCCPLSPSSPPSLSPSLPRTHFLLTYGPPDSTRFRLSKHCWLLMGRTPSQRGIFKLCRPSGVHVLDQRLWAFSCYRPVAETLKDGCSPTEQGSEVSEAHFWCHSCPPHPSCSAREQEGIRGDGP